MSGNNSKFDVHDMAREIQNASAEDLGDLFSKPETTPAEPTQTIEPVRKTSKKQPWTPDAETLASLPEMTAGPVTYAKSEIKGDEEEGLKNISDDNAIKASVETSSDLDRKYQNIEAAKKRNGIKYLHIPEGEYQVMILAAAGDTNYDRSQKAIDEIFAEIAKVYPEMIEYEKKEEAVPTNTAQNVAVDNGETTASEDNNELPVSVKENEEKTEHVQSTISTLPDDDEDEIKVVINKSQLPEVSWSEDEIDKIRKSRKVQLDIVEEKNLNYSQIEDVEENAVDAILAPYTRRMNDIVAALPASKYRCTFTGLSYPEVIDLSNSQELNNIDGEKKKWSIAYNHIKNQSIGPWEEYKYYIDPITKKKIKMNVLDIIPAHVNPDSIIFVSKFEDFLMKTSFIDLDFILWKILCATAMPEEIISIDCHAISEKTGKECGHSYDWVYRPADLLIPESINAAVLDDMEKASIASSQDEIEEVYKSSMLNTQNVATLTTSGFKVVFGHISAYEYLSEVYGAIEALKDEEDEIAVASRSLNYTTMTVIKAFLIPQENGKYARIKGVNNLMKVIDQLDEIDWQTLSELVRIMLEPYQFRYALRDIVCPKCKNRSMIPIQNMERLLFIVARSLSSVSVELKKI